MKRGCMLAMCLMLFLGGCGVTDGHPSPEDGSKADASSAREVQEYEASVVVVGGGGAGMTAALHAARSGERVLLLEQAEELGGAREEADRDQLEALMEQVEEEAVVLTQTRAAALLYDEEGKVRGLRAKRGEEWMAVECRAIVLATGQPVEENRELLSSLTKDDQGGLMLDSQGRVQRNPSRQSPPTKCGVELRMPQNNSEQPSREDTEQPSREDTEQPSREDTEQPSREDTEESPQEIPGLFAAGKAVAGGTAEPDSAVAAGQAAAGYIRD